MEIVNINEKMEIMDGKITPITNMYVVDLEKLLLEQCI
jgi:hypothetical protein